MSRGYGQRGGHVPGGGGGWVNRFWFALEYNDLHSVRNLLMHGANVDHVFKEPGHQRFGQTPAFVAASKNYREMLALLIREGADLDLPDVMGETPLFVAIRRGKMPLIKQIVAAGANINHQNKRGDTSLCLAIRWGRKEVVDYLLSVQVNVDLVNKEGSTPLLVALELLSDSTTNTSRCSTRRRAPSNLTEIVEQLIPLSSTLNIAHPNKGSALHITLSMEISVSSHNLKLSKMLLQHGATPDRLFFLRFGGLNAATSHPGTEFFTPAFFQLAVDSGAFLQKEKTWLMPVLNEMSTELQPYEELFRELLSNALNPMTLQSLCVVSIRRILCQVGPLWAGIDALPLPNTLKTCLKLKIQS